MASSVKLGFNSHGKGRVRLVKVHRRPCGTHSLQQYNVQIQLEGDIMDDVFLTGNNATVVATDTCKNTVYIIAKRHNFESIEEFGLLLARHFVNEYPKFVNRCTIRISEDSWERLTTTVDSKGQPAPHKHAFRRVGPAQRFTTVVSEKRPGRDVTLSVTSGIRNLDILKTTQSGFEGYHKDMYTTLKEAKDRLFGTSALIEWKFNKKAVERAKIDFNKISQSVEVALLRTFAGPSDKGVYSASVQQTLYEMGKAALDKEPLLDQITLEMPNIHNIPFPLENHGIPSPDHTGTPNIFFPIDEPHGMIRAVIDRAPVKARL